MDREYIDELKERCDIVEVAARLDCLPPDRVGRCYQGDCCPAGHESINGRCFTIWPETQTFKCFHCNLGGDVIELVMAQKKVDFHEAVNWLADYAGVPNLEEMDMTSEEIAARKAQMEEKRKVLEVLTHGARFYHETLMADKERKEWVMNQYGLTEETLKAYRVGYSKGHGLGECLLKLGYREEEILSTGLFKMGKDGEQHTEFFQGRIVFPYPLPSLSVQAWKAVSE